uniref:Amyloid beta (A4) protein-binding, family B, member 3 n=1 Tax=Zonotrichia albicollis TaxID=44394 RepID=A0A8D2NDM1_ZONAL
MSGEEFNNLWSDQSLETDPDLPPGWRKICDSLGTYYWHVPTGTTQWQHPARSTGPGGHMEADGDDTLHGRRELPLTALSLCRHSLSWHGDDFQHSAEPGSKCFAVRSLGWVEIPEEDLAPGKSSIAVNNCIQQLSNSKGQGSGQDLVMILKKDTMSLVDPLDRSLIHRQPILNIRVWGVGCDNGRDFAFVASDKDTCVLKCHVFHCNVPAKGIAKALHEMCSKEDNSWVPWGISSSSLLGVQCPPGAHTASSPCSNCLPATPEMAPACVPHLWPCCPLPIPPCSPAPAPCQALAVGAAQGSRSPELLLPEVPVRPKLLLGTANILYSPHQLLPEVPAWSSCWACKHLTQPTPATAPQHRAGPEQLN